LAHSSNSRPEILSRRPHKGPRNADTSLRRKTLSGRRAQELRLTHNNVVQSTVTIHPNAMTAWSWVGRTILMWIRLSYSLQSCQAILLSKEKGKEVPAVAVTPTMPKGDRSTQAESVLQPLHLASESATDQGMLVSEYQNASHSPPSATMPATPCVLPLPNLSSSSQLLVSQPQTPSPAPMGPNSAIHGSVSPTYTVTLARGFQFHYSELDLQQPSTLHRLVSSPDELYSVWDDSSLTWNPNECPLVIRGVSIAIKHWSKFYSNFKRKTVWDEIKQHWSNFKVSDSTSSFLRFHTE